MELIRESLDHCVKCTICETYCPVSNVTPLFSGPKFAGPQGERFRTGDTSPDATIDLCSGCGICTHVCPQGVKIAEINSRARSTYKQQRGIPLRDKLIARPALTAGFARPLAPVANWGLRNRPFRRMVEAVVGVHRNAAMPTFAGSTFQRWARRRPTRTRTKQVVYFHGCSTNNFEPALGRKVVAVLEHQDFEVIIPKQGCCGLPLQSNGLFDDARAYVRRLAAVFEPYARRGIPIVSSSTSCGLMLKREAREILDLDDEALELVGENTFDVCEFLLDLHDRGELKTDLAEVSTTVPYHAPCQQRGHGIGTPALDLFALIPGVKAIPQEADCCGIAGTYGVKKEKYAIAMDVGRPLFESILATGGESVACDSETCRWQISHATGMASIHPVELLHRSYGLGPNGR